VGRHRGRPDRLLRRSGGDPGAGGALRRGKGQAIAPRKDCSFETFLEEYDLLGDPVLKEISEIVHDADLMDEKYVRPESEGLDAIVRGVQLSQPDALWPYRRALRWPLRLPQAGRALRARTSWNPVMAKFGTGGPGAPVSKQEERAAR
jgi:hypothetical protein